MRNVLRRICLRHGINISAFRVMFILLAFSGISTWIAVHAQSEDEVPTRTAPAQSTAPVATVYLPLIQNTSAVQASSLLPQDIPHLGLIYTGLEVDATGACKGLLRVSGTNYCTHGPDLPPPGLNIKQDTPAIAETQSTTVSAALCDGNGVSGNRVQVLYVRASDRPNRYSQYLASFRQWANDADQIYYESATETGGVRHIRFVHDANCEITVNHVVIDSVADDDFSATVSAVEAQGYNRSDRKYMMFVDVDIYCGIGGIYNDDRPQQSNNNNFGPSYGRNDNGCWNGYTAAHELGHNLGAVQLSAPNSSGGYHCVDEYDVMCYSDDPYYPPMQYLCTNSAHENRLDCNHDDYYHTNPPAGSYLATHWNVANNQFLIVGSSSQPDLLPYTPSGYPSPVVPSSTTGGHQVNTLYTGQPTYFDWHFINSSNTAVAGNFHVELWVDSLQVLRYPYTNLAGNTVAGFDDWAQTIDTPGWHTVRLVTDPDNIIAESNEANNTWQQQFYWEPSTPQPDIFADSFESGDFSKWSFGYTNGGRLSVSRQAARVGSYGAQATVDDTHPVYLADDRPTAESRYRARFYFHPNSVTMANKKAHPIFYGVQGGGTAIMRIGFQKVGNKYQLRASLLNDATTWKFTKWVTISNAWHALEVDWQASTTTSAKNGSLTFWIDGAQKAIVTKIDNDTRRIDGIWLGPLEGGSVGMQGTYYFDDFVSRRQTYIGPAASVQSALAIETEQAAETVSEEANSPATVVSTTIQPGAGNVLTGEFSGLSVTAQAPVNTGSEPITVKLTSTDTQTMPDGYTLVGDMFTMRLDHASGTAPATYDQPVTLTIDYAAVVASVDQQVDISLQAWNAEAERWEIVPATVNAADHTISALLNQGATLAVWQQAATGVNTIYLPAIQQ